MKKILLLMMAIAIVTLSGGATKIYVCGTKITGTTSFSAAGGTVSYDDNTRVLTITNVNYTKSGSSNNGISVDELSGDLTINLYGTVKFTIADADAVLCKCMNRTTYINVYGTADFISKSSGHAGLKLQGGKVILQGSGSLHIQNTNSSSSANAIKGGENTETVVFKIKECTVESNGPRLYKLKYVNIFGTDYHLSGDYSNATTMIRFKPGSSNTRHSINVYNWNTEIKVFLPIDYYGMDYESVDAYYNIKNKEVVISDYRPAVIINSDYIPDGNLFDHLRYLEPQGYLTSSQMSYYTYLNLSGLNISNLTGLSQFANLKELRVENNNLTSLSGVPNSLQTLNCSNNKITSFVGLSNCSSLKTLDCSNNKISSLSSLPYLSIESLTASNNNFTSLILGYDYYPKLSNLNVSNCTKLTELWSYGKLTSLDVSGCSSLTFIRCENNKISSLSALPSNLKVLIVGGNQLTSLPSIPSSLEFLWVSNNKLTSFSLSNHSNIQNISIDGNPITAATVCNNSKLDSLAVRNTPALVNLYCYGNSSLKRLNFEGNTGLKVIDCHGNALNTISNLSQCSALQSLSCYGNQLTSLNNIPTSVQTLNCSNNKLSGTFTMTGRSNLKTLDINSNPSITTLNCYSNALTSLNVQNCSAMNTLQCYNNKLTSLNLTGCSALTYLSCQNNQITSFTNLPTTLQTIYCNDNKLSGGTFDVSGRSALKILDIKNNPNFSGLKCNNCSLTSLSVSGCTGLTKLICNNNQLTSLDVSSLSNLTELRCHYNKLASLNVSNKTKLTTLYANSNQLTSINVQGCSVLNDLNVECNKLTSLSVQGCNALRNLDCAINKINAAGANTLINSLCTIPAGSQGALRYIYPGYSSSNYVENNVSLTDAQLRAARNKRWTPYKFVSGTGWVEIPVNTAVPGDVNGDGNVTSADITALYDVLLNNNYSHVVNGDQTGDGQITAADVTKVYTIMLGGQN